MSDLIGKSRRKVRDSIDKILGVGGWYRPPMGPTPLRNTEVIERLPEVKPAPPPEPVAEAPIDPAVVEQAKQVWGMMDMHRKRPYMEMSGSPEGAFQAFVKDFAMHGGAAR